MDRYELTLATPAGRRVAADLECTPAGDGHACRLVSAPIDQAALFGLLRRVRDHGLELVAVRRLPRDPEGALE